MEGKEGGVQQATEAELFLRKYLLIQEDEPTDKYNIPFDSVVQLLKGYAKEAALQPKEAIGEIILQPTENREDDIKVDFINVPIFDDPNFFEKNKEPQYPSKDNGYNRGLGKGSFEFLNQGEAAAQPKQEAIQKAISEMPKEQIKHVEKQLSKINGKEGGVQQATDAELEKLANECEAHRPSYIAGYRAKEAALSEPESIQGDAVEFAEWKERNGYVSSKNGNTYYWFDYAGEGIGTTAELYKLFKNKQ